MSRSIKIKCPKLCLLYFFCLFFYSSNFISGKNVAVAQIQTDVHCLDVCIVDLSAVQMRESVFCFLFLYQRNNKLSCIDTCMITWLRPKPLMDNHHGPPMSATNPPPCDMSWMSLLYFPPHLFHEFPSLLWELYERQSLCVMLHVVLLPGGKTIINAPYRGKATLTLTEWGNKRDSELLRATDETVLCSSR